MIVATFVLIHGSWHASWCWTRVAPELERAGHRVVAPTLIGLGELAHLATPDTGVSVHVNQVARLLTDENVSEAVLVGHSYGGMILTGVAEVATERLGSLVYLDAVIPHDGQTCFDLLPGAEVGFRASAIASGCEWLVPPMSAQELGVTEPGDAAWVDARLTAMPLRTHTEPVSAPRERAAQLTRAFILCERFGFAGFAEQARAERFEHVTSIDAGHDVQLTHPAALCDTLLAVAGG